MSEPKGLWFRAIGMPEDGGVIKAEVWETALTWRHAYDCLIQQPGYRALIEQYALAAPKFTLQTETVATFARSDLGG